MKPPICAICNEDFRNGGGLIYFKENDEDIVFNKRLNQKGMVGHPTNAFWFCKKHYSNAEKLKHLTKSEAFDILRNPNPSSLKKLFKFIFGNGKNK